MEIEAKRLVKKSNITTLKKEKKSDSKVWDELLNTPESDALLALLINQSKLNEKEGKFEEDDW